MKNRLPILFSVFFSLGLQMVNAQCWKSVQTGANHNMVQKNDGTLWAWGSNSDGVLGNGSDNDYYTPYQVGWNNDWQMVSTGKSNTHHLAIKNDGSLWSWGYNFYGQLGYDVGTDYETPVQVGTDTNWKYVASGMFFSIAIKTSGTLWGWGSNAFSQVNSGVFNDFILEPTLISADTNWVEVSCGDAHNLALTTSGQLFAWGFNLYGQVGNGSTSEAYLVQIAPDQTWLSIAAGDSHSLAVRSDNTLWSWGYSSNGQLGNGVLNSSANIPVQVGTDSNWAKVFCGEYQSFGIKTDGTLWAWGDNGYGQLGIGNNDQQLSPVQVGTDNHWIAVQSGRQHTIGLKEDHTAFTWGRNTFGTLGNGTYGGDGTGLHIFSNVPVLLSCGGVDVNETLVENAFNVYPNPASDRITIVDFDDQSTGRLEIFNVVGERVYSSDRLEKCIDVNELAAGTYILVISKETDISYASFVKE